jgi:hypothetical protein
MKISIHLTKKEKDDNYLCIMDKIIFSSDFRLSIKNNIMRKQFLDGLLLLPMYVKEELIELDTPPNIIALVEIKRIKDAHTFKGCEINL